MRSTLIERETIGRREHDPKTDICMGADAPDPPEILDTQILHRLNTTTPTENRWRGSFTSTLLMTLVTALLPNPGETPVART
jgi:hypothetical protein